MKLKSLTNPPPLSLPTTRNRNVSEHTHTDRQEPLFSTFHLRLTLPPSFTHLILFFPLFSTIFFFCVANSLQCIPYHSNFAPTFLLLTLLPSAFTTSASSTPESISLRSKRRMEVGGGERGWSDEGVIIEKSANRNLSQETNQKTWLQILLDTEKRSNFLPIRKTNKLEKNMLLRFKV